VGYTLETTLDISPNKCTLKNFKRSFDEDVNFHLPFGEMGFYFYFLSIFTFTITCLFLEKVEKGCQSQMIGMLYIIVTINNVFLDFRFSFIKLIKIES
jgi:hypothetical protein